MIAGDGRQACLRQGAVRLRQHGAPVLRGPKGHARVPTQTGEPVAHLGHEGCDQGVLREVGLGEELSPGGIVGGPAGRPVLRGQLEASRTQLGTDVVDGDVPVGQGADPSPDECGVGGHGLRGPAPIGGHDRRQRVQFA